MNETILPSLEELLREKIALYCQLRDCLVRERERLITMDLDHLWALSDEKHDLCSKIESLREKILSRLQPSQAKGGGFDVRRILDALPRHQKPGFQNLHLSLIGVKAEIENLRKENKAFVEDSLQCLDEMHSILTGESLTHSMYDRKFQFRQMGNRLHLSREV
jgi:hypothetical protein